MFVGWLVTDIVAKILLEALANCKTLTSLQYVCNSVTLVYYNNFCCSFWNVGLSSSALNTVVCLVSEHNIRYNYYLTNFSGIFENNIRELSLDGNRFSAGTPITELLQCKRYGIFSESVGDS